MKLLYYLPLNDNDGRDLRGDHHEVQSRVFTVAGGWTFTGFVEGAFRMKDGSLSLDRSAAYVVVVDEERIGDIETVLRDFKAKTLQEAIYLEVQRSVEFRFIRALP